MMRSATRTILGLAVSVLALSACDKKEEPRAEPKEATPAPPAPPPPPPAPVQPKPPRGLPELVLPADGAMTPERIELGKQLFFDRRLGKAMACAACHVHEKGWTDGKAVSVKGDGKPNTRNAPSLYNVGYQTSFYWDGRSPTLEKQIEAAWKGQIAGDPVLATAKVGDVPAYKEAFGKAFGGPPTAERVVSALAAFLRSLQSGDSAYDRMVEGDKAAMTADAQAGYKVFLEKGGCVACHTPPLFTDGRFHNVGIGLEAKEPDLGRGKITNDPKESGAFKTPSLRAAPRSAPYFHDGSAKTLEDAVRIMAAGGKKNPNLDPALRDAKLTDAEVKLVAAFIRSLQSPEKFEPPRVP